MAARGDSGALLADSEALLMREFVGALESAAVLRAEALASPFATLKSGRVLPHPGFVAADRDARRAIQLAKAFGLDKPPPSVERDPFAHLDGRDAAMAPTNLAARRKKRARK
jgi:hypothetical protein